MNLTVHEIGGTLELVASIAETALATAVSFIGVTEVGGNNCGPQVEQFLASVGLGPGYSWCAAFLFYCFRQAAQQLAIVNPCPRTAGAIKLWTLSDSICRVTVPVPGCIYVLDHGKGQGHAGLIELAGADGTITEVSGNTNAAGSREGNAVARHSGASPEAIHGGRLLGLLNFDLATQRPLVA